MNRATIPPDLSGVTACGRAPAARPDEGFGSNPAVLFGFISLMVLIWSVNFIIAKVGLKHMDPLTMATFRVVLAGLITLPVYAASRPHRRLERPDVWKFAQLGLLGVALNQVCFVVGLNYTTVGHSSLIVSLSPIYVLLLARAQGMERLTAKKLAGMTLSFTGVAVLATEHGLSLRTGTLRGDLITLGGSLAFSLYAVLGKKVAARYDSVSVNTFGHLTGAILVLPLAAWQARQLAWGQVGWQGWGALLYMAGLSSVAAYIIFYWALRHLAASRLTAFSYLQPVLATLLGAIFLGERLTGHLVAGGGMVLVGVYLAEAGLRENSI